MIGFLGSTHCIGMCGGIASIVTFDKSNLLDQSPLRTTLNRIIAYNSGRISSYMIAGLLVGILGSTVISASPQHGQTIASFVAAGFMIALGLYLTHWWNGLIYLEKLGNCLWRYLSPIAQRFMPIESGHQAYGFGLIWGWLPCGLVYSALVWSLSTANPIDGMIAMAGFGIGTLPAMILTGTTYAHVRQFFQQPYVRSVIGLLIIGMGIYGIVRNFPGHHHHALSSLNLLVSNLWI
jgi:uncharacterized protein